MILSKFRNWKGWGWALLDTWLMSQQNGNPKVPLGGTFSTKGSGQKPIFLKIWLWGHTLHHTQTKVCEGAFKKYNVFLNIEGLGYHKSSFLTHRKTLGAPLNINDARNDELNQNW